MKKTKAILGLPIISISSAEQIGKVNNLIVNGAKGTVDYILVETGEKTISSIVISTNDIIGVGEYAATVEFETVMNDISKIPEAIGLLQKNVELKNTNILTKKGNLIGKSGDFYVNEDDFKIEGLEFIEEGNQNVTRIIPRKDVITFGKALIVVSDDVKSNLIESEEQLPKGNDHFFHKSEEGVAVAAALEEEESEIDNDLIYEEGLDAQIESEIATIQETEELFAVSVEADLEIEDPITESDSDASLENLQILGEQIIWNQDDHIILDEIEEENILPEEEIDLEAHLRDDDILEILEQNIEAGEEVVKSGQSADEIDYDSLISLKLQEDKEEKEQQFFAEQTFYKMDASHMNDSLGFIGEQGQEERSIDTFEQKQIQYLSGKILTKNIVYNGDKLLAKAGDEITPEIIQEAKKYGKLIELIMNCK